MENNNDLEVMLFSNYSRTDLRRKELLNWLATTLQSTIRRQHERRKKIFLRVLKDTPAIYPS